MDDCSICLQEMTEKTVLLECTHEFHLECLSNITNNSCPLCRANILTDDFCKNNHNNRDYFYVPNIKKNGVCRICYKKSFAHYLKEKFSI